MPPAEIAGQLLPARERMTSSEAVGLGRLPGPGCGPARLARCAAVACLPCGLV